MKQNRLFTLLFTSAVTCAPIATAHAQCACDFNNDGVRDALDHAFIIGGWGTPSGDCTGDGTTDGSDQSFLFSGWGACPSPPAWAEVVDWKVNATVVTDVAMRMAIIATDLPWRVRDTGTGIEMLLIPPGFFTMGCTPSTLYGCDGDENPTHTVTLTNEFYLGRYEVTQAQWTAKMGSNPSQFQGSNYPDAAIRPVEQLVWDGIDGIVKFNTDTGLRLPTEAEWEYAYRAQMGTKVLRTAFHNDTNEDVQLGNIAWHNGNSGIQTHAVGGKAANALGLHDMSGNVWEWVNDWYSSTYYSESPSMNPTGPLTGSYHVKRGGSWLQDSFSCRASERIGLILLEPNFSGVIGIRSARNP